MAFDLTEIYKTAYKIRVFEEAVAAAADAGKVPGLAHLCSGAETLQAAICHMLDGSIDQVTGSHRSHGLALAMGADSTKVAAEIFGKATGLSRGFGGTQHLLAPEKGFLTSNGIVGGQVPLAAGAALTAKTLKTGGIGVAFFGDGAANQGAVLETMNLAVALELPLLFVLENNGMGQTTASDYASGGTSLADRADAFNMVAFQVAAADIFGMEEIVPAAVDYVRNERQPAFLETFVPRLSGHYHGDSNTFDSEEQEDPLLVLEDHLKTLPDKTDLENDIQQSVQDALAAPMLSSNSLNEWHKGWEASQ